MGLDFKGGLAGCLLITGDVCGLLGTFLRGKFDLDENGSESLIK